MIDIEIGIVQPELRLTVPAAQDSLPVVRQVLRSLGETVDAGSQELEDAELAVTEACANAVEHAYEEDGDVLVTLRPREADLLVSVRDYGRGMPAEVRRRQEGRGFGLSIIEGIADDLQIRGEGGTEVAMALPLGTPETTRVDGGIPGIQPAERILRRLVAVVAAQADMPIDRVMETLLVAELVARNGLRHLVGDQAAVRVDRMDDAFELRVGPFEEGGAQAVVDSSDVPAIGSVVARLVDGVQVDSETVEGVDCEYLRLRIGPRS